MGAVSPEPQVYKSQFDLAIALMSVRHAHYAVATCCIPRLQPSIQGGVLPEWRSEVSNI